MLTITHGGGNASKKIAKKEGKSFRLIYLTWPPAWPRLPSIL